MYRYIFYMWSIWGVLIFHRPFSSGSCQSSTRISCVVALGIEGSLLNYHLCCAGSYRDIDSMENETIMLEGPGLHSNINQKVRSDMFSLKFKCMESMQGNIPYIRRIWVLNSNCLDSIFISFLIEFLGMFNSPCEFFLVGVSATTCRFFGHSENRIKIISTKSCNQYQ